MYLSYKVGGLPFVMGRIGESAAKILVDSGAGATLVHKKLVPPQTIIRSTPGE